MTRHLFFVAALLTAVDAVTVAQTAPGPFARIAVLRPHDGKTTDFEAGYIRHLDWHAQNRDPFRWYGYSMWSSEHQRWFVYATFGHSSASLSNPINPAEDERDTLINVIPHVEFLSNWIYEFLPGLSKGSGVPSPRLRTELTTVDLRPGSEQAFERALSGQRSSLHDETLWYRLVSGGRVPRYVRVRPMTDLRSLLDNRQGAVLPRSTLPLVQEVKVEILSFRPTLSYNVEASIPAQAAVNLSGECRQTATVSQRGMELDIGCE